MILILRITRAKKNSIVFYHGRRISGAWKTLIIVLVQNEYTQKWDGWNENKLCEPFQRNVVKTNK